MSGTEIDILLSAINEVGKKADNAVINTIRIEGKLKGHHKYITDCYSFRDDQVKLNRAISDHLLIEKVEDKHEGSERRRKALRFNRILQIITILIAVVAAVFVGITTF
jgi:hypothetical protein